MHTEGIIPAAMPWWLLVGFKEHWCVASKQMNIGNVICPEPDSSTMPCVCQCAQSCTDILNLWCRFFQNSIVSFVFVRMAQIPKTFRFSAPRKTRPVGLNSNQQFVCSDMCTHIEMCCALSVRQVLHLAHTVRQVTNVR